MYCLRNIIMFTQFQKKTEALRFFSISKPHGWNFHPDGLSPPKKTTPLRQSIDDTKFSSEPLQPRETVHKAPLVVHGKNRSLESIVSLMMDWGPGNLRHSLCLRLENDDKGIPDKFPHDVLDVNVKFMDARNEKCDACWCISSYNLQYYYIYIYIILYPNLQITRTIKFTNHMGRSEARDILERWPRVYCTSVVSYIGLSKISPRPSHWCKQRGRMRKELWIKTLSGKPQLFWGFSTLDSFCQTTFAGMPTGWPALCQCSFIQKRDGYCLKPRFTNQSDTW